MLLEQYASNNRWRQVNPAAKGLFSLCGLTAVLIAVNPRVTGFVALVMVATTMLGAGIPLKDYLRVAAPALLFLLASGLTLLVSLRFDAPSGPVLQLAPSELPRAVLVCTRSLGGFTALLFLAFSTPVNDIIALLRRLKLPEVLLDLMVLCHRMLFALSGAINDMRTAQAARLGNAGMRQSLRSLGILVANLMVQVWQRSLALYYGALTRNNDGALRFLEPEYPDSRTSIVIAALGGSCLMVLALVIS